MPLRGGATIPGAATTSLFAPHALTGSLPQQHNSTLASTMRSWNRRAASAQAAGIPLNHLADVARLDFQRVMQGHAPLSNLSAATSVRARMHGKKDPITDTTGDTGFIGDIVNDIKTIGSALNPVKLVPTLVNEAIDFAKLIPHIHFDFSGNPFAFGKAFHNLATHPGFRMLPGVMTGERLTHDPRQIQEHPIQTLFDLTPLIMGGTAEVAKTAIPAVDQATILGKEAAGKIALRETGRIPEEAMLTPVERAQAAALHGRPYKALWRKVAPEQSLAAEQGATAFLRRMGFGTSNRWLARQQAIMGREAANQAHALANEYLRPTMEGLSDEERKLVTDIATRPDLHPPGSYDPKYLPALHATHAFGQHLADASQVFGEKALTAVPYNGQWYWFGAEGAEGEVARAWQRVHKAEGLSADTYEAFQRGVTEEHAVELPKIEAQINKLAETYARQTEGRTGVPAPPRMKGEVVSGMFHSGTFDRAVQDWLYNVAPKLAQGKSLEDIQQIVTTIDEIKHWYGQGAPVPTKGAGGSATVGQQLKLLKGLLSKESRESLVAHLEANNLTHVRLRSGREVDMFGQLGVRKPGRIYGRAANPTAAEKTLAQMHELRDQLDSGEYVGRSKVVRKLERAHTRRMATLERMDTTFKEALAKTPPASFHPMLYSRILEQVTEAAKVNFAHELVSKGKVEQSFAEGIDHYLTTLNPERLLPGIEGQKLYNQIKADVFATWQELADEYTAPVWVHNVTESTLRRELSIKPYGTEIRTPGQLKVLSGPNNSISDVMASMTAAARQHVERLYHQKYLEEVVLPYTRTAAEVENEAMRLANIEVEKEGIPVTSSKGGILDRIRKDRYERFDPQGMFGFTTPRLVRYAEERGVLYIPKELADTARSLLAPAVGPGKGLARIATQTTSLFKMAVLGLSLKHMVDVFFSDTMFLMLRGGKEEFSIPRWMEAIKDYREGRMPIELPTHLDMLDADHLFQVALGKKMGSFWKEHSRFKNASTILYRIEETVNNVQRMVSFKSAETRALKAGLDEGAAREAALAHTYKTILDIDSLVPLERTILRQVFPFYSFMRYIYSYALTFPFDHPLRVAIINRVAAIEQADRDSGLPQMFQQYFFLGQPDAQGNVTSIDVRQMNPFRDISNFFTFAGFVQQLHPVAGSLLQVMGINTLNATPELYPNMRFDPYTGRMVNTRPDLGQSIVQIAQGIIPQVGAADYFLLMTDRMRQLKASSPEAYKQMLYRSLFLPFSPRKVNIGDERQKFALARLKEGELAVSKALQKGQPLPGKYKMVPYQGQMVPGSYINNLVKALKKQSQSISPKAIAPR